MKFLWKKDKDLHVLYTEGGIQGLFEEEIIVFQNKHGDKKYTVKNAEKGAIGPFETLEMAKKVAEKSWADYEIMSYEDTDEEANASFIEWVKDYVIQQERYKLARLHLDGLEPTNEEKGLMEEVVDAALEMDTSKEGRARFNRAVDNLKSYREDAQYPPVNTCF